MQNSINLISNSTLDNIWARHFLDSGQLYRFTKNISGNILDFGSGAGFPGLILAMMGNNSIRSEGKPKYAMYAMMLPSISNLFLDYLFIYVLDWGMEGAAWATTLSYLICTSYILFFFCSGKSDLFLKS